jgi:hypothetical protein
VKLGDSELAGKYFLVDSERERIHLFNQGTESVLGRDVSDLKAERQSPKRGLLRENAFSCIIWAFDESQRRNWDATDDPVETRISKTDCGDLVRPHNALPFVII